MAVDSTSRVLHTVMLNMWIYLVESSAVWMRWGSKYADADTVHVLFNQLTQDR